MAETSLLRHSPPSTATRALQPFRFLDLPAEIRNKIYCLLLTARPVELEGPDYEPGYWGDRETYDNRPRTFNFGLAPEILRTCRSIKSEGEYVLQQNLFVKLAIRVDPEMDDLRMNPGWIRESSIPCLDLDIQKPFEQFELAYEVTAPDCLQYFMRYYIILYRDLDSFLSVVSVASIKSWWTPIHHRRLISHVVNLPVRAPLRTERSQARLIAPFRARLPNTPRFTIQGSVSQEIRIVAEREILPPPPTSPDALIREVEVLKRRGACIVYTPAWHEEYNGIASEYFDEALQMVDRAMMDISYQEFREKGGQDFLNRLTELAFDLSYRKAKDYFECMHGCIDRHDCYRGDWDKGENFAQKGRDAISYITIIWSRYRESTWRPSPAQLAEVFFQQAKGCRRFWRKDDRLEGSAMLEHAYDAIQQALLLCPDNPTFQKEKLDIEGLREKCRS